jgi:hypothetical protein
MILTYTGDSAALPHDEHVVLLERYEDEPKRAVLLVRDADGETYSGPDWMFRPFTGACICDVCCDERAGRNPKPVGVAA